MLFSAVFVNGNFKVTSAAVVSKLFWNTSEQSQEKSLILELSQLSEKLGTGPIFTEQAQKKVACPFFSWLELRGRTMLILEQWKFPL